MKAVVIKKLEMPTGENNFIDVRINSDGTALLHCGMGKCITSQAEQIEYDVRKKKDKEQ